MELLHWTTKKVEGVGSGHMHKAAANLSGPIAGKFHNQIGTCATCAIHSHMHCVRSSHALAVLEGNNRIERQKCTQGC